jgi:hypothetical protein
MGPLTDTANTRDWLEATKDIKLTAYIESRVSTLSIGEEPLRRQNLYDALRRISVPVSLAPLISPQLRQELQSWDALSDEALLAFERELG